MAASAGGGRIAGQAPSIKTQSLGRILSGCATQFTQPSLDNPKQSPTLKPIASNIIDMDKEIKITKTKKMIRNRNPHT
jgi:hypothetical protein